MNTRRLNMTLLFWLLSGVYIHASGQTVDTTQLESNKKCVLEYDSVLNRNYYILVDVMPTYRGGLDTMLHVLKTNMRWPGGHCDIQGTIYIAFIIEQDGQVTNKRIFKSFMDNDSDFCHPNREALNAVDFLTDWIVGECNGKKVAVQYVIPIRFGL